MAKIKNAGFLILFIVYIQNGSSYPQGFFPKFASWNKKEGSLTVLPSVKVNSPVKTPFINVFGNRPTSDDKKLKIEENLPPILHPNQGNKETNPKQNLPNINKPSKEEEQPKPEKPITNNKRIGDTKPLDGISETKHKEFSEKPTDINDYVTDNQIDETYSTTDTSTDDYETTTMEYELLNRASPQLVASLLG